MSDRPPIHVQCSPGDIDHKWGRPCHAAHGPPLRFPEEQSQQVYPRSLVSLGKEEGLATPFSVPTHSSLHVEVEEGRRPGLPRTAGQDRGTGPIQEPEDWIYVPCNLEQDPSPLWASVS